VRPRQSSTSSVSQHDSQRTSRHSHRHWPPTRGILATAVTSSQPRPSNRNQDNPVTTQHCNRDSSVRNSNQQLLQISYRNTEFAQRSTIYCSLTTRNKFCASIKASATIATASLNVGFNLASSLADLGRGRGGPRPPRAVAQSKMLWLFCTM